ncbi:complex I 24 kDa subunit family protein [Spirochaeta africana]|uniref:NADH:ubiquinone oxidoreductase 24 kD subunit n=1 Tax=Spirochaeta africana (strain ATCC 700263 / DSM 8902 / Z-7692) TaxID=889378 RepID=H9ULP3_SPIAZ|nr:NAD(P)H-dependent oxidoreductase subunit E [Spirochaeta africana]AFG38436.1 NADH:ubiquinone oxidoreductase 24 kD subunit [Spirochaeta africana DSM 8902]
MATQTTETQEPAKLSDDLTAFIDTWKDKRGNLIMILHRVQQEYGYVPRQIAIELSRYMGVPLAKIYGVLTFYHYFKLKKPGRHRLAVCMGTACYLKGGQDLIDELENLLDIGVNQTTEDGEFSVEAVRCVGCCGLAPLLMVGDEVIGKLKTEKLPEVIAKLREA